MRTRGTTRRIALGAAALLVAACGSSTTPTVAPTATTAPPASQAPGGSPSEEPSTGSGDIDLFTTGYAPADGQDGGTAIIGDWQEATQFNPFYLTQVTEANVAAATWATLAVLTHDYKFAADLAVSIPTTTNGGVKVPGENGDAMTVTWKLRDGLKWSDGQPLTCEDFRYTWKWVLDPDNTGVVTAGYDNITDWACPSDTDMVLHFNAIFEGYILLAIAPLPEHYLKDIPVKDQV